jgi:hypothetical protein
MFGEYAALAKWALIIGTLSALVYAVEDFGYNRADSKWKAREQIRLSEVSKLINEANTKAAVESEKSSAYAGFIEEEYNERVKEINKLKSDVLDFGRVRQSTICRHNKARLPENNNTKIHDDTAAIDDTGLTPEFRDFINSQVKRDEMIKAWIESSIKEINKLCGQPNVICEK